MTTPFSATVLGLPRIGPKRELKRALESLWAGRITSDELLDESRALRSEQLRTLQLAGLDSIPVGTFSLYDHVLDTAVMLGALPSRYDAVPAGLERYFAAARGTDRLAPLEMTKWFDTNYHYLVPEIGADTTFALHPDKLLSELAEAQELSIPARPVVLGPVSFLKLSKSADGDTTPLDRLDDLLPLYADLLAQLAAAGAEWVQLDEPSLVTDLTQADLRAVATAYDSLTASTHRPAILVASYFGDFGDALPVLAASAVEALGLDLVAGSLPTNVPLQDKLVVAGVVEGRNIWRTDLDAAVRLLRQTAAQAGSVAVSTSCSLLHVPYSLAAEQDLDPSVRSWLAFGAEKVDEVVTLARSLVDARAVAEQLAAARTAYEQRRLDPRRNVAAVRERIARLSPEDRRRAPATTRAEWQATRLGLPSLPSTTIGSYPQTPQIRAARVSLRKNEIDAAEYREQMRAEIRSVIDVQEQVGLDVLVHGEPERNDMVQYFAEQLEGFVTTAHGWVQSYGSRCVRPPILFGDVRRTGPMTVEWISYAQSLTAKAREGHAHRPGHHRCLVVCPRRPATGRHRRPGSAGHPRRDRRLEESGALIVQVDEPALRELLPLRRAEQGTYLKWAVDAFLLATAGVSDDTQIHTHLCYSEFGEVIEAIAGLDADVTSVEAARSHMEVLGDLNDIGFDLAVGPGVYDIHSPRVPEVEELAEALRAALATVPASRLWVNPDCGLKTRSTAEVSAALRNLVDATKLVRSEVLN